MLYARSALYYVSLMNDLYGLSPFLIKARAFGDKQNLTTWMNVPIQLCSGIIGCYSNTGIERTVSLQLAC